MNRRYNVLPFLVLAFAIARPGFALERHGGPIGADQVWTRLGSPHVLSTTVTILPGATVTVEAGAVIAAAPEAQLVIDGTLITNGTPEQRVLITGYEMNEWGGVVFEARSVGLLYNTTVASSGRVLFQVTSAEGVLLEGDSLMYSPIDEAAVGLSVGDGQVTAAGVLVGPLDHLYSIPIIDPVVHDRGGSGTLPEPQIRIEHTAPSPAAGFALHQNYPNPFNPTTTIRYSLGNAERVRLQIFDLSGHLAATLVEADQTTGDYSIDFFAANLPSGSYLYRLQAGNYVETREMLLMK